MPGPEVLHPNGCDVDHWQNRQMQRQNRLGAPLSFWQYQDGGSWLNFGLSANNQLNKLVAKGEKEVKVGIWTIDTNQMEQRNVSTGTNRKVRPPIHWQWHDGEIYRDYDLKTSSMIYDGISNSRTELKGVLIASNKYTLDLNMASMEQINERTKVKRQICHPNMKSDVFATVVETGIWRHDVEYNSEFVCSLQLIVLQGNERNNETFVPFNYQVMKKKQQWR